MPRSLIFWIGEVGRQSTGFDKISKSGGVNSVLFL